ncbi:D-aminoacyl-tRNA deacylase [Fodinibius salsisoli]|uniref:D-aminoacyl-tRNA deacylase n=1 Tax=Fodinibius salsisoli TaxID=2820877 RepID=A0ABT3PIC4_9BACT|nr:D-aminoacyl-tRNA deacylase [Fodinibius salsisoli]MCW9705682.1 D-tyrosyl-tRNA(Tyr) deacylase [Fodinibius salsisoli]
MKIVLQRVSEASVWVDNEQIGAISHGLMLLVGIHENDSREELEWLCDKVLHLRIFDDEQGKMNLSVQDVEGQLLVVPQFTLYGDYEQGNRPSYMSAAKPQKAEPLYEEAVAYFKEYSDLTVEMGQFGAYMDVRLRNDGPVTLVLER